MKKSILLLTIATLTLSFNSCKKEKEPTPVATTTPAVAVGSTHKFFINTSGNVLGTMKIYSTTNFIMKDSVTVSSDFSDPNYGDVYFFTDSTYYVEVTQGISTTPFYKGDVSFNSSQVISITDYVGTINSNTTVTPTVYGLTP